MADANERITLVAMITRVPGGHRRLSPELCLSGSPPEQKGGGTLELRRGINKLPSLSGAAPQSIPDFSAESFRAKFSTTTFVHFIFPHLTNPLFVLSRPWSTDFAPPFRHPHPRERVRPHQDDMPVPARIARPSRCWNRQEARRPAYSALATVARTFAPVDTAPQPIIA